VRGLRDKICRLKQQRHAVILAHNYQRPEVQDIADFAGDSLELSRAVVDVKADVVVFCGVHFMAETASILNPQKKILLPVREAGCPMADMITLAGLRRLKKKYPRAPVVCYVNSSAAVKAESYICCTSSNAAAVVAALPQRQIIFVPDQNLGRYIQGTLPDKQIILWQGFCPTHIRVSEEEISAAKRRYPKAQFLAHPECPAQLLRHADYIGSTSGMLKYVTGSSAREFIVGTENGMIYRLQQEAPRKKFYSASEHFICADMKLTTLGWIAHSLEHLVYEVNVPDSIRKKARVSLERMMATLAKKKPS
jgi:quinolinate synthase